MTTRIAINGLGRIGRSVLRAWFERSDSTGLELVALNELADIQTLAHLTRYDSTHGKFAGNVASNVPAPSVIAAMQRSICSAAPSACCSRNRQRQQVTSTPPSCTA